MDLRYSVFFSKANIGYSKYTFESIFAVILNFGIVALLMFFPVFGVALSIFFMGYLCLCYKGYYVKLLQNKKVGLEDYFVDLKYSIKAFLLKFAITLISILWALLLIVPGIVCAINYSMSFYILADDKSKDSITCMEESKKLVQGARGEIFLIYLCEIFVTTIFACLFSALTLIISYYVTVPLWLAILIPTCLTVAILLLLILPYFEMMLSNLYIILKTVKSGAEKKTSAKRTTRVKNNTSEIGDIQNQS